MSLNFRVRDGIGCYPHAIVTGKNFGKLDKNQVQLQKRIISKTIRLISTTRLKSLLILHLWPINVVVSNEPYYHKDREI
jgi:hypothetical protein